MIEVFLQLLKHNFISSIPKSHRTVVACRGEEAKVVSFNINGFDFLPGTFVQIKIMEIPIFFFNFYLKR